MPWLHPPQYWILTLGGVVDWSRSQESWRTTTGLVDEVIVQKWSQWNWSAYTDAFGGLFSFLETFLWSPTLSPSQLFHRLEYLCLLKNTGFTNSGIDDGYMYIFEIDQQNTVVLAKMMLLSSPMQHFRLALKQEGEKNVLENHLILFLQRTLKLPKPVRKLTPTIKLFFMNKTE